MRKRFFGKRFFVICTALLLLFTGCSAEGDASKGDSSKDGTAQGSVGQTVSLLEEGEVFTAKWGETMGNLLLMPGQYSLTEDALYYLDYDYDQEGKGVSVSYIFRKEPEQEPEAFHSVEKEYMNALFTDRQGAVYCILAGMEEDAVPHMIKYKADGTVEWDEAASPESASESGQAVDAGDLQEAFLNCKDCKVAANGSIVLLDLNGNLYLFDADGHLTKGISAGEAVRADAEDFGIVDAGESGICFYTQSPKSLSVCPIDPKSGALGQAVVLETEASPKAVYSGYEKGILVVDEDSLWLYGIAGSQKEKLVSWGDEFIVINADDVEEVSLTEENEIALLVQDQYRGEIRRVDLVRQKKESIPEIRDVTVGVITSNEGSYGTEWYQKVAQEFHKIYPAYRLEVKLYDTDGADFEMDLLKGEGPDLIELAYLDTEMLASKGVLEDLTPYFGQSSVHTEDLLPSVVEAGTVNGSFVRLIESMSIQGMVVESGAAREGGWTPDEFLEMIEANPGIPLNWSSSKSNLLALAVGMDMEEYVDWSKRECYFQEEPFLNLLKRVSAADLGNPLAFQPFAAQYFRNHEVLSAEVSIGRWENYLELKEAFGENADFVGYPNTEGVPKYRIVTSYAFGMNSASSNKEGAWAFLEFLASEDYQRDLVNTGFSVRKDVLEKQLQEPLASNLTMRINPYDGQPYKEALEEPSEEDLEAIRSVIDHACIGGNSAETAYQIIVEEADNCFFGGKSVEEAAEVIQSRVTLYLNE